MSTKKPEIVYRFIVDFKKQYDGNSPTIREIAIGCNISSTSMVNYYLDKLIADRRISMTWVTGSRKIIVSGGVWRIDSEPIKTLPIIQGRGSDEHTHIT